MKNLKKLVAFLVCVLLVTLLTACSSSRMDGRWFASAKVNFNVGNFSADKYTFLENTTCNYNLTFAEDGTYNLSRSVPKNQRDIAVEEYQRLYIDYFKSKHTESEINELVESSKTCETADEYIKMALLGAANKKGYSNVSDFVCDSLDISTKVLASGSYKVDGDIVYLYSSNDTENPLCVGTIENNILTMKIDSVVLQFAQDE